MKRCTNAHFYFVKLQISSHNGHFYEVKLKVRLEDVPFYLVKLKVSFKKDHFYEAKLQFVSSQGEVRIAEERSKWSRKVHFYFVKLAFSLANLCFYEVKSTVSFANVHFYLVKLKVGLGKLHFYEVKLRFLGSYGTTGGAKMTRDKDQHEEENPLLRGKSDG